MLSGVTTPVPFATLVNSFIVPSSLYLVRPNISCTRAYRARAPLRLSRAPAGVRQLIKGAATSQKSVKASAFRGALREAPVEHAFGDAVQQHFDRAAGDHPAPRAAQAVFDQAVLAVARPAHHLDRLVRAFEAGAVARHLGDRGLLGRRQARVRLCCRPL